MKKVPQRAGAPKSKILKAALDLFSSGGYSETTMSEIARSVGLSVGALYLRFRSKEELCLELIRDQTNDSDELTDRFRKPGDDPLQALRDYMDFSLEYAFKKKQLLSIFIREFRLPFMVPLRKKFLASQHKIIKDILAAGTAKGIFRPMDHDDVALMIFASMRGAVLLKIVFGIGDVKKISDSLFQLVICGIGKDSK
ncbi:MAG: TetR/AcrR family transcriptional regulator [Nitrospirae bacterium]|nr:TetR/AcrR family transcriptional regulator [Nitrospirota bacterium]